VATVAVRWIMAGVYLVLLRRIVPRTIGQDLDDVRHATGS
jgi:hypothetical protein